MNKFALITRGRTGSTAVLDELGKSAQICTVQEVFRKGPFTEDFLKDFGFVPPFDEWKGSTLWQRAVTYCLGDERRARRYLTIAESIAEARGAKAFGFKVLSHHLDEKKFLQDLLIERSYRAVYLRRNIARQVLSGMVANQRGIWNPKETILGEHACHIDLDKFKWLVQWERECVRNDCIRLERGGFDFIEVCYEDFCDERESFYANIFTFLHLPLELPPPSDYVKAIENLESVIENFNEVAQMAASLGEALEMPGAGVVE